MVRVLPEEEAPLWLTMKVWPAMETVPDRAAPLFAATENATAPLPLPDAPEDTVMKPAFEVAVQEQPAPPSTFTAPSPPLGLKDREAGESVKAQIWAPVIVIVKIRVF